MAGGQAASGPAAGATWTGLVDDAALFPPGEAPLPDALPAHAAHRASWYADLVGPFVFPAPRLGELASAPDGGPDGGGDARPLDVSLTLPGGPAGLAPALRHFAAPGGGARLVAVEVVLPEDTTPRELVRTLDRSLPDGVRAFAELPRTARRDAVLDALAGSPHRAKLRTGGTVAAAFPGERELAETIVACVRRGVPFKCTAGLHRAVRHTDPGTGFEHHGFVNVTLATAAALDAAVTDPDPDTVAAILAERSPDELLRRCARLGPDGIAAARASFTSFGSCSVLEPVDDLTALGLLERPRTAPATPTGKTPR